MAVRYLQLDFMLRPSGARNSVAEDVHAQDSGHVDRAILGSFERVIGISDRNIHAGVFSLVGSNIRPAISNIYVIQAAFLLQKSKKSSMKWLSEATGL